MRGTILLNFNENLQQIEAEEKNRFIRNLLEQMGVPIDDIWETDDFLSVDQKIKLRELLSKYNVQVIDDLDGNVKVYVEGELAGNFEKPIYKLKRDFSQLDPKKQLYLEMEINCWTPFEEDITQNQL